MVPTAAIRNVTNGPPTSNNELLNSSKNYISQNLNGNPMSTATGGGKKLPGDNAENCSSPDLSDLSNSECFKFGHGNHNGESMAPNSAPLDQQKTILLKIPNVSESEQLLVSNVF